MKEKLKELWGKTVIQVWSKAGLVAITCLLLVICIYFLMK